MTLPSDVAREVLLAYCGLSVIAARGFQLRASAETLAPRWWGPAFLVVAVLMAVAAVVPTNRVAILTAGAWLHLLLVGRIFAAYANDSARVPGASMTSTALLGVVLLSSALVWRYLLWPPRSRA